MYLKRLESVGFKSFAERIHVEFVPGVTAVVGPNGSGKSNISDAIRWVLGEQSVKSLRGSKMEDIIFQGSDTRKQLNVAEVTLVLDNSAQSLPLDYDEVSITRRVYRSGVSEFYINKQSCRLKDIIDLFMDSGLGREAFSIISQGKVEEVLSSKAEERRTIFEEAAGVSKYKQRKKKAEYKLAETQENLSRVDDIIYEIEQQIEPLQQQAETAKEYIQQSDMLKQQEISLLITEIESLHGEWTTLLAEIENERMAEIKLKTSIQQKEVKLETDNHEIQNLDEAIEALQTKLLITTQQLEQDEGKRQVLHERTKHFSENKTKLEQQKSDIMQRVITLQSELAREQKEFKNLQKIKQATDQNIKFLEKRLVTEQDDIVEQIETLKLGNIEYLNQQAAKHNEKQSIQQQLQQLNKRKDQQVGKSKGLTELRKDLIEVKAGITDELSLKEKNHSENVKDIQLLKHNLGRERNHYEQAQGRLSKSNQSIAEMNTRKEMLEEMKQDFQGFFHGVKAVLTAREKGVLSNVHGAVIELIDVPKKYITAIETALGGQAQHIVVDEDKKAREVISWLKQTNNGRATFLPLKSINPRYIATHILDRVKEHPGFIGIASGLVNTDARYETVVHHLMGHVIIVKTLKDANDIAVLTNRKNRIVTLGGDVVNPGGSMSGGAKKNTNQSLFTRERDLEEITNNLQEFQNKAILFEQEVTKQKQQIEEMERELEIKEKTMESEQQILQEIRGVHKKTEMELMSLNENLHLHDQDQLQFDQDSKALLAYNERLIVELSIIEQQLTTAQAQIKDLTEQAVEFKGNQEQQQQDLHREQISLAEQNERMRNQHEKTTIIEMQISELEEQLTIYTTDLDTLEDLQRSEATAMEIDDQIQSKKEIKDAQTSEIQEKRAKRLQNTQLIQDLERELKQENKKHHDFIQVLQQKEVKANRLDVALENQLSHLQTAYTITFEMACKTYDKTEDVEATKSNVEQLKTRINALGTVNLGAVNEYERISERYVFLTAQKDDLAEAKATLYSIISEMDEVMIKRFKETFTRISEEFTIVFKELFGGGHAKLTLTDPQNILDTGIEIIAQPPGKKLQHLGLLSGGERALTAISLLFSILRVRPVPFCVLDEVEAALDEANVIRFAKYVKLHSSDTQFIVITHRKGTMEEADVLYGVTMQESGVSRLVSVQLEDTVELINT